MLFSHEAVYISINVKQENNKENHYELRDERIICLQHMLHYHGNRF